jgi:anti-sigma B factor antagonist
LTARCRRATYATAVSMTAAPRHLNTHRALQRLRGRSWYRFLRMRGGGELDQVVPVTFTFSRHLASDAGRVSVVGPFNQWNPAVHPLRRIADGDWTITIYLPPGRIIYYFDVDGVCWLDPRDEGRVPNTWGTEYSVRDLAPAARLSPAPASLEVHVPIRGGAHAVDDSLARSLDCHVELRPDVSLLRVRGEVDLATVAEFEAALREAVAPGQPVILSLREVRYLDSAGLHCLGTLQPQLSAHGQRLVMAEAPPSIRRLIEIVGCDEIFPIFASIEAALRYLIGTAHDR